MNKAECDERIEIATRIIKTSYDILSGLTVAEACEVNNIRMSTYMKLTCNNVDLVLKPVEPGIKTFKDIDPSYRLLKAVMTATNKTRYEVLDMPLEELSKLTLADMYCIHGYGEVTHREFKEKMQIMGYRDFMNDGYITGFKYIDTGKHKEDLDRLDIPAQTRASLYRCLARKAGYKKGPILKSMFTIQDILNLKFTEFVQLRGVGETRAYQVRDAMRKLGYKDFWGCKLEKYYFKNERR